jgi:hypothetical protein
MEILLNLLMTEPYDDGQRRYVGMYNTKVEGLLKGGPEVLYQNPEKLFDELRKTFGEEVKILVRSEDLPAELSSLAWFSGRISIDRSELSTIIENQQKGGRQVELVA